MGAFCTGEHRIMISEPHTIPARRGTAVRVRAGESIMVINTHGSQVVDTQDLCC